MFRAFVFVPPKRSLVLQFPMGRGPGGRRARRASLSREAGRCVCVCVGGWGVGGMASARRPRSRECSRRFSPSGPGSVTRQTLAVKQPTTWLSVVRVGVRVETRRSFSRPFPRSPRSVLPAKVGLRPSAQPLVNTTAIASMRKHKPAFFLNRGRGSAQLSLRFPNRREEAKMCK